MNCKILSYLTTLTLLISANSAFGEEPTKPAATQRAQDSALDGELSRALDRLSKIELKGEVSVNDTHDKISKTIEDLTTEAIRQDPEMVRLNKGFIKYTKKKEKVAASVAAALNYGILTRGDMPSSEAGDVILDEKVKLKSKDKAQDAGKKAAALDARLSPVVESLLRSL